MKWVLAFVAGLCLLATQARADRVHLSGGSVVEGKATRQGDRVVVEVESGELTLPAESVERIETADSDIQRFEARYAKWKPGDVKGLMALADFCRDHELRAREQRMLQKVVELAPDHKEARARLGYVHTDNGWVTREEQLRAQGLVQHDGQWVTREQLLAIERAQAQADTAAHERDKAQAELEAKRLELEKARASKDAAQASPQNAAAQPQPSYATGYAYPTYAPYTTVTPYTSYSPYAPYAASSGRCWDARCSRAAPPPAAPRHASFPIAGVRDPFDYFR